ncbi:hypothetical protein KIN20_023584 [Parelaphostrongylus tenuis]|uniref:Uncharacterized protein n=1 Tax=Parelaphostrongylus tenuis TaxID=148309 RepID=A0AAD5QVG7_PARTN|nr:hypothetical protein KIN20_023584 [Parelaphostrongylus tenuis]
MEGATLILSYITFHESEEEYYRRSSHISKKRGSLIHATFGPHVVCLIETVSNHPSTDMICEAKSTLNRDCKLLLRLDQIELLAKKL